MCTYMFDIEDESMYLMCARMRKRQNERYAFPWETFYPVCSRLLLINTLQTVLEFTLPVSDKNGLSQQQNVGQKKNRSRSIRPS